MEFSGESGFNWPPAGVKMVIKNLLILVSDYLVVSVLNFNISTIRFSNLDKLNVLIGKKV